MKTKMRTLRKAVCVGLAVCLLGSAFAGCGKKEAKAPSAKTGSMEDVAEYLKAGGVIESTENPVNINETEGYVTDNTGGQFAVAALADKACDYDGVWLFWWDLENQTEAYEVYDSMKANAGVMVYMGGAAILETKAHKGAFAIAFAEGFEKEEKALELFNAMTEE